MDGYACVASTPNLMRTPYFELHSRLIFSSITKPSHQEPGLTQKPQTRCRSPPRPVGQAETSVFTEALAAFSPARKDMSPCMPTGI